MEMVVAEPLPVAQEAVVRQHQVLVVDHHPAFQKNGPTGPFLVYTTCVTRSGLLLP